MPAPGHGRDTEPFHGSLKGVDGRGDGAVTDDMESGRDAGLDVTPFAFERFSTDAVSGERYVV